MKFHPLFSAVEREHSIRKEVKVIFIGIENISMKVKRENRAFKIVFKEHVFSQGLRIALLAILLFINSTFGRNLDLMRALEDSRGSNREAKLLFRVTNTKALFWKSVCQNLVLLSMTFL